MGDLLLIRKLGTVRLERFFIFEFLGTSKDVESMLLSW